MNKPISITVHKYTETLVGTLYWAELRHYGYMPSSSNHPTKQDAIKALKEIILDKFKTAYEELIALELYEEEND